ncbi:MAG: hypothetical protein KIS87_13785 [Phycisphaeraceae bacterium]|nr:hypothetical protein [Phycisphaeraceae bacterium]
MNPIRPIVLPLASRAGTARGDNVDARCLSRDARHGRSGGNHYHYDAARVFSFSALLDLGGGTDRYNSDRTNDATTATGSFNESSPGDSDLHGVFADR